MAPTLNTFTAARRASRHAEDWAAHLQARSQHLARHHFEPEIPSSPTELVQRMIVSGLTNESSYVPRAYLVSRTDTPAEEQRSVSVSTAVLAALLGAFVGIGFCGFLIFSAFCRNDELTNFLLLIRMIRLSPLPLLQLKTPEASQEWRDGHRALESIQQSLGRYSHPTPPSQGQDPPCPIQHRLQPRLGSPEELCMAPSPFYRLQANIRPNPEARCRREIGHSTCRGQDARLTPIHWS